MPSAFNRRRRVISAALAAAASATTSAAFAFSALGSVTCFSVLSVGRAAVVAVVTRVTFDGCRRLAANIGSCFAVQLAGACLGTWCFAAHFVAVTATAATAASAAAFAGFARFG